MANMRLDVTLFETGKVKSREKAKALIMEGAVYVNGQKVDKPGYSVNSEDTIELKEDTCPFVSRGGLKLQKALKVFQIDVNGMTALDIGASTGGFTDCLLQNGAKKVYSIDVGYNQLAYKLQTDERVVVMERTNFRHLDASAISEEINIAVMDVSFISITKLCPNLKHFINENSVLVFLIKPQFEADKNTVGKNGVIHKPEEHKKIVFDVVEKLKEEGYYLVALDYSPVKGPKGNIEYISLFSQNAKAQNENVQALINNCVELSHKEL